MSDENKKTDENKDLPGNYAPAWSHVTEDEFHGFVTEADAIAAWNRRAHD